MGSYDRLFPNQDTLPRGGFGNLIALPLQHSPRQMGNTVFVDNHFVPHPDQWWFLSTHPRIDPATVEPVAHEAMRQGLVVGVRLSDTSAPETLEPWPRRPSGQPPTRFAAPLSPEVRAVLAQRLFVAKRGLAPTHLNQIKRLAAFQNPESYKTPSLHLSHAGIPVALRTMSNARSFMILGSPGRVGMSVNSKPSSAGAAAGPCRAS